MNDYDCSVCRSPQTTYDQVRSDLFCEVCPRCGEYQITGTAVAVLEAEPIANGQVAAASGWVRSNQGVVIRDEEVRHLRAVRRPSIAERAKRIIVEVARRHPGLG